MYPSIEARFDGWCQASEMKMRARNSSRKLVPWDKTMVKERSMAKPEEELDRVVRPKEQAEASYDKASRWYDLVAGRSEKKFDLYG